LAFDSNCAAESGKPPPNVKSRVQKLRNGHLGDWYVSIALSLSSGFTAENEVAARVGELYVNNGGVCGRLTLKAKSQKG
jgi:hypothetical protein